MSDRPPPRTGDRGTEPDDLRASTGVATVPPAVLMSVCPPDERDEKAKSSAVDAGDWLDFLLGILW